MEKSKGCGCGSRTKSQYMPAKKPAIRPGPANKIYKTKTKIFN